MAIEHLYGAQLRFPWQRHDAIFHLATAVVFSAVAAIQLRRDRMHPASA